MGLVLGPAQVTLADARDQPVAAPKDRVPEQSGQPCCMQRCIAGHKHDMQQPDLTRASTRADRGFRVRPKILEAMPAYSRSACPGSAAQMQAKFPLRDHNVTLCTPGVGHRPWAAARSRWGQGPPPAS